MSTTKLIQAWRARGPLTYGSVWWWMLERCELAQVPICRYPRGRAVMIGADLTQDSCFYTCEEDALADLLRVH